MRGTQWKLWFISHETSSQHSVSWTVPFLLTMHVFHWEIQLCLFNSTVWWCESGNVWVSLVTFLYSVSLATDAITVSAASSLLWFILDRHGKTFNTSQTTFFTAPPSQHTWFKWSPRHWALLKPDNGIYVWGVEHGLENPALIPSHLSWAVLLLGCSGDAPAKIVPWESFFCTWEGEPWH